MKLIIRVMPGRLARTKLESCPHTPAHPARACVGSGCCSYKARDPHQDPLNAFDPFFCRGSSGLVGPCAVVGAEEMLAAQDPLDPGQVWNSGRFQMNNVM